MTKKPPKNNQQQKTKKPSKLKNRPLHIPLDFEKAVIGWMKVKPKKDQEPT
jgi:hypothetical protein